MTFKYLITVQDWVEFNIYHMTHSKVSKASRDLMRYIGIVFFILLAYVFQKGSQDSSIYWVTSVVLSFVWFLYYPDIHKKEVGKQAKKMFAEDENKGFLGNQALIMDDESITVTNEYSCNKMKWSLFNKIISTDEYVYIYDSSVSAIIIPASAFENIEEMKSFYHSVEEKIKKIT